MFYSWLSVGIVIENKESFKKFLDLCRDPKSHQSLMDCSLGRFIKIRS